MSNNKIYYWLKLNKDFFEDDTISWLEEQENGKDHVIFYLKLCLKSLEDNGMLIRYVGEKLIPYDVKALSRLTNTSADTVKVAMNLFLEIGLVSRLDSGEIYMNQIDEMIGSETESAKRVRKHRAKKKELEKKKALQCNIDVIKSNTEKEKETEKELELEKEQEQEEKSSSSFDKQFKELAQLYQKCGFDVNGMTPEWIEENLKKYGYEWLKNALLEAESRSKRTKKYVDAILNNWNSKGGMTLRREGAKNGGTKEDSNEPDEYAGLGISIG